MSQFMKLNLMNQLNMFVWPLDIFNDSVIFTESVVAMGVLFFIWGSFGNKYWNQNFGHWLILEAIWTTAPVLLLLYLGLPSLKMLYASETFNISTMLSVKVMGHQWYWEYNLPEFDLNFMSYPSLLSDYIRLAECDFLMLPYNSTVRFMISSQDVIHSWALPSLGFKMDACPGRLNFYVSVVDFPGKHFGQCSELCGVNHSWMPIYIEFSSMKMFFEWLKIMKD